MFLTILLGVVIGHSVVIDPPVGNLWAVENEYERCYLWVATSSKWTAGSGSISCVRIPTPGGQPLPLKVKNIIRSER
jgi:hypothetical protein